MLRYWFIPILLLGSVSAHAASFDCSKASTPQDKAVCASHELGAADIRMAAAYKALLVAAPAEMAPEIRDEQRAWIRGKATTCMASSPTVEITACLSTYYSSRTKQSQQRIVSKGGVTFIMRSIHRTEQSSSGATASAQQDAKPGYFNASWPQTKADTPEWKAWNSAIEAAVHKVAGESDYEDMDTDVTASLGIVSNQLVTASLENYWYGHGAAHPNETSIEFNWLLQQKRELRPEDVFLPGSNWDQLLQKRCIEEINQQHDPDYEADLPQVVHRIILDPENWQLDAHGLSIVFQTYSVSARADPVMPILIPWHALQPLLQPGFARPK